MHVVLVRIAKEIERSNPSKKNKKITITSWAIPEQFGLLLFLPNSIKQWNININIAYGDKNQRKKKNSQRYLTIQQTDTKKRITDVR